MDSVRDASRLLAANAAWLMAIGAGMSGGTLLVQLVTNGFWPALLGSLIGALVGYGVGFDLRAKILGKNR